MISLRYYCIYNTFAKNTKLKSHQINGSKNTIYTATIGDKEGPNVALIGELDGILCATHPYAVKETGLERALFFILQL